MSGNEHPDVAVMLTQDEATRALADKAAAKVLLRPTGPGRRWRPVVAVFGPYGEAPAHVVVNFFDVEAP